MSDLQIIQSALEKTARRHRWQRAWRGMWQGVFWGAATWLLALIIFKLFPVPETILTVAGVIAGVLVLSGFLLGWRRKLTLGEAARWVDQESKLKERLSTALEFAEAPAAGRWRDLLVTDAATFAKQFDPRKLLPFQLPKITRWALLVLVLGAGLGFAPEYRSKDFVQQQKESENIKDTGRNLTEFTRRNLEQRPPAMETTRKAMDQVQELGERLSQAKLTRNEALREIANVTDKLKQEAKELARNPALKRMDQAARSPTGSNTSAAELQKKIDDLQKAMGDQKTSADALEKMQQDLQKLKEAASGMASQTGAAAQMAQAQMAQALSDLAKQAQEMGMDMANLNDAIAALKAGQIDQMLKELEVASQDLEQLKDMAQSLENLQQMAKNIGKDLAEQLQNGQAEAAVASLQKMMQELKKANLSPEQMAKMMEEVAKAVKPAGNYGDVAEKLQKAAQQMKAGQKGEAGQSLADAAKELQDLMQQLGDAQSLMASMEALQTAQMCVGNGMSWGQCQGGGSGKLGQGRGRGTPLNEWDALLARMQPSAGSGGDNWGYGTQALSGDGQADMPENTQSTKVRGQISPGSSMPSISLRGVSIKGESHVQYTEAVTAAQSDAQSALSEEQVPRAYQGAVRDYFDDLKE